MKKQQQKNIKGLSYCHKHATFLKIYSVVKSVNDSICAHNKVFHSHSTTPTKAQLLVYL